MKLFLLTSAYSDYLEELKSKVPENDFSGKSLTQREREYYSDFFSWSDSWLEPLRKLGISVSQAVVNSFPLQTQWAEESGVQYRKNGDWVRTIALKQVQAFQPEILWYDYHDAILLKQIRETVPSIKKVVFWLGSALPAEKIFTRGDLVLSCAPETVDFVKKQGVQSAHLDHAFDPRIISAMNDSAHALGDRESDVAFIGQILQQAGFHFQRGDLLKRLSKEVDLSIYSSSGMTRPESVKKRLAKQILKQQFRLLKKWGTPEKVLERLPFMKKAKSWQTQPVPISPELLGLLKPAVYGLRMYRALRSSKVVLNIHADSSPLFASNMRLFETTGAGGCLLTDWRDNLPRLFVPDQELVSYRSPEECVEKALWLVSHPSERQKIAQAGQKRCLQSHTFEKRAEEFKSILQSSLKNK